QCEVIPRDLRALEAFRIAEPSQTDRDGHHGGCAGKGFTRTDVVANIWWREPWRDASLVSVKEHHQAPGIVIGQWSEHHAVHDRKNRRRRADAERQGQDRHTGESGLPSQQPPRMTQVSKQKAQPHPPRPMCPSSRDGHPAIRLTFPEAEKVDGFMRTALPTSCRSRIVSVLLMWFDQLRSNRRGYRQRNSWHVTQALTHDE